MLDLSLINNDELFEVKLIDGRILHLKRPTQSLQSFLIILLDNNNLKDSEMLDSIFKAFTRILNRNEEGIAFNAEDLAEEYGVEVAAIVINDYFTYWNEKTKVDFQ